MEKLIYNADFSDENLIFQEPDFSSYNTDAQEFMNLSVEYAKKSKSDIEIVCTDDGIRSILYLSVGIFMGKAKTDFLKFAKKSNDFIILPTDKNQKSTLKINAFYEL